MNIKSTAFKPQTPVTRKQIGEEFNQAKEEFVSLSEDHFDRADSYDKWGARIGFGLGAGVLVGGGYLMHTFAGGIDGYGAAFPPVLAAAGTVWVAHTITQKLLKNKLSEAGFAEARAEVVEKRDQYRDALLKEVNDDGVRAITQPRWDNLKSWEDQSSPTPTNSEFRLLQEVNQLEFLADQRQSEGWLSKLAFAQDDPRAFEKEANLVVNNDGIHKVMVDTLGVADK